MTSWLSYRFISLCVAIVAVSSSVLWAKNDGDSKNHAQKMNELYWGEFDQSEKLRQIAEQSYMTRLRKEKEEAAIASDRQLLSQRQEQLLQSIEASRQTLGSAAVTSVKDIAVIAMVQDLYDLAHVENELGEASSSSGYAKEGLSLLSGSNVAASNQSGVRQRAHYLSYLLKNFVGEKSAAGDLQALAKEDNETIYVAFANLHLGDQAFNAENMEVARRHYERANVILRKLNVNERAHNLTLVRYRLAWTYFRLGELELAVQSSLELLKPGVRAQTDRSLVQIQADATEILGNALYELNDYDQLKNIAFNRLKPTFAAQVVTVVGERYEQAKLYDQLNTWYELTLTKIPNSEMTPFWLVKLGEIAHRERKEERRQQSHARLAGLLPPNSLWRAMNPKAHAATEYLESVAPKLGEQAADYYYDAGSKAASVSLLTTAAAIYRDLIDFNSAAPRSNWWLTREAHCYYFSENYPTAIKFYERLLAERKLDKDNAEIVTYQLALSKERMWRKSYEYKVKSPTQVGSLDTKPLCDATDLFANTYPQSNRAAELMLITAAALRDNEQMELALTYWRRVLASKSNPAQRATAIRGVVFAAIRSQQPEQVVAEVERFLKVEDFNKLGKNLEQELQGVLAEAAMERATILSAKGQGQEAGVILARIAEERSSVPMREKMYREGGYMLAVGGDWQGALTIAERYLEQNLKAYRADMIYLKARSQEYQLLFGQAAVSYLTLAREYPKHKHATVALERSYSLATAEGDHRTAAQAAELLAKLPENKDKQHNYYVAAFQNTFEMGEYKRAQEIAQQHRKSASNATQLVTANLNRAKALTALDQREQANELLLSVVQTLLRERSNIARAEYARFFGESQFLLGMAGLESFKEYRLNEASGTELERIRRKTIYFEAATRHFELAISSQDPLWSSHARYEMAEAATSFADELTVFTQEHSSKLADRVSRLNDNSEKLHRLAKRYHSENVMARNKSPQLYRGNQWVRLSSLRLSGSAVEPVDSEQRVREALILPNAWSL